LNQNILYFCIAKIRKKMIAKYSGLVVHGLKNGRKFGYPTVNILLDKNMYILDNGVFAVEIYLFDKIWNGMLYIGNRATLDLNERTIEIHIFDFNQDIYNLSVQFAILKKIRDDQVFENVDQLIFQIQKDELEIKNYFSNRY
jgi:riboflavin kinase / FMN adenylyltransferase